MKDPIQETDTAPANPDEKTATKNQTGDIKPPLIFVGKTFRIASTFPEWYGDKLKQDIQTHGGILTDDMWDSNYVIHNPPSSTEPWFDEFKKSREAIMDRGDPVPVIRPYHWIYSCIHHNPPSILKINDLDPTQPFLTSYEGKNPDGKIKTKPLSIYCTVNMPSLGEESSIDALKNVVRSIESNGAYRSLTRKSADILILDPTKESGQRFSKEKLPHQTCYSRSWLDGILKGTSPYIRNRPPSAQGKQAGTKAGMKAESSSSGTKTGQQKKKKAEPVPVKPARMEYSEKDDEMVIRWLYHHDPEKGRWKSIRFYQDLCNPKDPKYLPFADRHSSQSWHERVRKRYIPFAHRGDKFRDTGLDRLLRTRKERAELQLEEVHDDDQTEMVENWAQRTAQAAGTEGEGERPRRNKGKEREMVLKDQVDGSVDGEIQEEAGTVRNGKRKRTTRDDDDDDETVEDEPARKQPKNTAAATKEPLPALPATKAPQIPHTTVEQEPSPPQPTEVPPRSAPSLQEASDEHMQQDDDEVVQETPPEVQRTIIPTDDDDGQVNRPPQADLLQFMQEVVETVIEVVQPALVNVQQGFATRIDKEADDLDNDSDSNIVEDFMAQLQPKRRDKGKGRAVDLSVSPQPEIEQQRPVQRTNKRVSTASEREVQNMMDGPEEQTPEPLPIPQKVTPEITRSEELPTPRTAQQKLKPILDKSRAGQLFDSMTEEFGCKASDVLECMKLCAHQNNGVIGIPELRTILSERFTR